MHGTPKLFTFINSLVDSGQLASLNGCATKTLIVLLKHADTATLESFPAVESIAKLIGEANPNRTRKYIRQLERAGLVTATRKAGRVSNVYRITIPTGTESVRDEKRPGRNVSGTDSVPSTGTESVPPTGTESVPLTDHRTDHRTDQSISRSARATSSPSKVSSRKAKPNEADYPGFVRFWSAYPPTRRVAKPKCLAAWIREDLESIAETIIKAVEAFKATEQWAEPRFIPHSTTFLNQRRWESAPEPASDEWFPTKTLTREEIRNSLEMLGLDEAVIEERMKQFAGHE